MNHKAAQLQASGATAITDEQMYLAHLLSIQPSNSSTAAVCSHNSDLPKTACHADGSFQIQLQSMSPHVLLWMVPTQR
jgi:hypothetical protein